MFQNPKYHLADDGKLYVFDANLATQLNRHLKIYDNGKYVFVMGEEAIFFIHQNELNEILERFLGQ